MLLHNVKKSCQKFVTQAFICTCTGELRYLEFQGNGENTSSFPKFEIANYDITRIHVHEEKKSTFIKPALLKNVCNTNLKDVCIENKIEIKTRKMEVSTSNPFKMQVL